MRTGAVVGIQDMGAAGLACCTSEMPARSGTGMDVELSRVPQRETGMTPYEILLSESQERMLLVAARGREEDVRRVFSKWELDAVEIGHGDRGRRADGAAQGRGRGAGAGRPARRGAEVPQTDGRALVARRAPRLRSADLAGAADYSAALVQLLASPTIASKEWAFRQYDQQVGINTLVLPGLRRRRACASRARGARSRCRPMATAVTCSSILGRARRWPCARRPATCPARAASRAA